MSLSVVEPIGLDAEARRRDRSTTEIDRPTAALSIPDEAPARSRHLAQRVFDIGFALPAALLATPIILLLALISAIVFRAFPFFIQERLGYRQSQLRFLKIRSLPADAPADADKYALRAIQNKPYGRFIRRTHLDELPQLYLVLLGRMSLVGPRPEMPVLAERCDPAFVAYRSEVRPGCTGLWQISDRVDRLIGESPEYDLFYIEHQSMRLDLWIVWHTVLQFLGSSYRPTLADVPAWALRDETEAAVPSG